MKFNYLNFAGTFASVSIFCPDSSKSVNVISKLATFSVIQYCKILTKNYILKIFLVPYHAKHQIQVKLNFHRNILFKLKLYLVLSD